MKKLIDNSPFKPNELKIVVIGGGTGSFMVLDALKHYTNQIAALVNMVDDGGSTGQLRDELGALPPGDVRQCLVALSRFPEIRELFSYRFESGALKGHAFGNLFLSALEKMKKGNFADGVKLAGKVLNIVGTVEPMTLTSTNLVMQDGEEIIRGESKIGDMTVRYPKPKFWLEPKATANPMALGAIMDADMVVISPGNLYCSLVPALLVDNIDEALVNSKALKVYVCNLMTMPEHTNDFMVHDFANELERLVGKSFLDVVLFNTKKPGTELLKKYAVLDDAKIVKFDEKILQKQTYQAIGANLLSSNLWQASKADPLLSKRTLIRHDSMAVAESLFKIYHRFNK